MVYSTDYALTTLGIKPARWVVNLVACASLEGLEVVDRGADGSEAGVDRTGSSSTLASRSAKIEALTHRPGAPSSVLAPSSDARSP